MNEMMKNIGYSALEVLMRIIKGNKVWISPKEEKIKGTCPTELYTTNSEYLGSIIYDKKWRKWVLFDLDNKMQMSEGCIKEAFELTKNYWEKLNNHFSGVRGIREKNKGD